MFLSLFNSSHDFTGLSEAAVTNGVSSKVFSKTILAAFQLTSKYIVSHSNMKVPEASHFLPCGVGGIQEGDR